MFLQAAEKHLTDKIIPFWQKLKDKQFGGYYGFMGFDLTVVPQYEKGCILNSRILWFFSNAFLTLGDETLLQDAEHAYRFFKEYCLDKEYGGVFWSVAFDGKPKDTTKHTYNQAFAIYALSSYYDASGDREALEIAQQIYHLIEDKCRDEYGYLEAFDRQFNPASNEKLSENGVMAEKTMNTLLHVLEAYTELYRVSRDESVAANICWMLDIFADKVYNKQLGRQEVFFDKYWHSLIDLYSYGHDIETTWLVDRALDVLADPTYKAKISPLTKEIAENIYQRAYKEHSLCNEAENGKVDTTRIWWVQAEAVVGFLNAYEKDRAEVKYLQAAEDIWQYIQQNLVDSREGSEWFWALNQEKEPLHKPIVEPWKCPYHNGRMCMEIMRRLPNVT